MKKIEFIYLSQEDIIATGITLKQSIDIVEGVFREHGDNEIENPPKGAIHPLPDAFLHSMPGWLKRKEQLGIKLVGGFFSNMKKYGLPPISGVIILNDVHTGMPIAILEAGYITVLRTAAASGVAAKYLAKKNSEVIGVIGAGLQGRYQILTLREVLPDIKVVKVFDHDPEVLDKYVNDMRKYGSFDVEPENSAQTVISESDVALTATGMLEDHVFMESWIQPGSLILPIHSRGWDPHALHRVDKFVVDDFKQIDDHLGQPGGHYYPMPESYTELGEVVTGLKPGRERADERILDINFGLAIHDIAMSSEIVPMAKEKGLGTILTLSEEKLPFT